jgi:hypothetical protein
MFFSLAATQAQNIPFPLHSKAKEICDRLEILGFDSLAHSTVGVYLREEIAEKALKNAAESVFQSKTDQDNAQYLLNETALCSKPETQTSVGHTQRERGILKYFYKTPAHLFTVSTPDFRLAINPVLDMSVGNGAGTFRPFRNERGVEVFGDIGRKVQFYTKFQEIQARLHDGNQRWVNQNLGYPGMALTKEYQGTINKKFAGFDTNISEAYVAGSLLKQVRFQFGHGRHFIGNGYRSMLLSDFSPVYLYLRLDTKVWRFHYTNLFTEMSATQPALLGVAEKKHIAAHYLDFQVTKNWSVGLYETTVFARQTGFEAQYLNPVILYRSVEGMIGSPDNVLIGLNSKINLFKTAQIYGQLMLDEFYSPAIINPTERGWWANKAGTQIGIKYLNAFKINQLDLQVEMNTVRPYTYSHDSQQRSYTHYGQPLAHPLGANFREVLGIMSYQPTNRINIEAKAFLWKRGHDDGTADAKNYGGDPWRNYNDRVQEYGNFIGQGSQSDVRLLSLKVNFMLAHNIFLETSLTNRRDDSANNQFDSKVTYGSVGVRMHTWRRRDEI